MGLDRLGWVRNGSDFYTEEAETVTTGDYWILGDTGRYESWFREGRGWRVAHKGDGIMLGRIIKSQALNYLELA